VRLLQGLECGYRTPNFFGQVVLAGVCGFEGGVVVHGGEGGGEGGGVRPGSGGLRGGGGVHGGDGVVPRYARDGLVCWFGRFCWGGGAATAGVRA